MDDQKVLKILVITSRPLVDSQNRRINLLDVEKERARVRDALQNAGAAIHTQFLPSATVDAVTRAFVRAWDVAHITGHGSPDGELLLEDEFGVAQFLNARDVVALMGESLPRVVVLSLCYAGQALPDALLHAGAQTVIAIDADELIPDHAATLFNETFYALLARGESVGNAFERAQTRVRLDPQVGDRAFAASGVEGPPYSERFTRAGNDGLTFASEQRAYQEFDTPRALGNLRERNRNFVGRAQEIVQIVKAFDARGMQANARRVALHGAGGLGKTELAQAVAWWYVERGRVGAVVWASANPTEDEFVLRDLGSLFAIAARALKLNFSEQMPFDEQKAIVRDAVGEQETLLLLDNWETLVNTGKAREVWDFVLSLPPRVRVLVTSRDKLPPKNAENIELDTLAPDDAAKLFLQIARSAGYFKNNPQLSAEETAILGAIIERLGGYALAIEVVAGQTESRTLGAIWRDLVQIPKNVLEGKTEFGEPRGIWTSLDFSYNVLPDAEKQMFRGMGVLLAPATDEDITAITTSPQPSPSQGDGAGGVRETLDTLVRRSLVRFREGHYALLPIVRDYAESRLADAGQDPLELHLRAVNHFANKGTLEGALTASDHLYELAARFQSEQAAKVFIEYVNSFYSDLLTRGYWAEARRKTEDLIVVARGLGDKVAEAYAFQNLALHFQNIGDYERALPLREQAMKMAEEIGDRNLIATNLHNRGMLERNKGNYPEALRLLNECLELRIRLGDKLGIASSLGQIGNVAQVQGNYTEALRLFSQSMEMSEEIEDKRGIATSLEQMGTLAEWQNNHSEAQRLFDQSLKLRQELGDQSGIAQLLYHMGITAKAQGNYPEAIHLFEESLQLKQKLGDKGGIANILYAHEEIEREQGNDLEASQIFDERLQLLHELGDKHSVANTILNAGFQARVRGKYTEAREMLVHATAIFRELSDKRGIARGLSEIGVVAQHQGSYGEALERYGESLQLFQELEDRHGIADILHQMGNVAYWQGHYGEALRFYQESLQLTQLIGDKRGIASTLHQLGMVAQQQGNYGEALRLYGESLNLKKEVGDKHGIANSIEQSGQVVQLTGELKDALKYFLDALSRFIKLESPNRYVSLRDIASVRVQGGQEQFMEWLRELIEDEEDINDLIEILEAFEKSLHKS
ncbi:MAG: hypothetical protein B6D41_01085 [Chloroflexi bacterium UTCFX4]|jgi:tetratricopeptide (TPR) repeat protein|nr:MAG: hypothetical protein B6D41_01085 [Chloroflexi bacterium UTCFX4]